MNIIAILVSAGSGIMVVVWKNRAFQFTDVWECMLCIH